MAEAMVGNLPRPSVFGRLRMSAFSCVMVTNVEECGMNTIFFKISMTCGVSVGSIPSSNVKKDYLVVDILETCLE